MKNWLLSFVLLAMPHLGFSQDKKIDQLEVLYSQTFYSKVFKKANKLLAIPDYDYSGMPSFYKSLALFRLLENEDWMKRHPESLKEAIEIYDHFLTYPKAKSYVKSHYFEIAELKQYLLSLEKKYKTSNSKRAKTIKHFVENQLKNITPYGLDYSLTEKKEKVIAKSNKQKETKPRASGNNKEDIRTEITDYAKTYIGTPYSWAGTSPKGFDCSGYTGYVYKKFGITLPRSAAAQKDFVSNINKKTAEKGDLVFFKSGHKITHVGIVISELGEPLTMVHSSSSKGIIITEVETSTYWRNKFAGVGRIIQ